MDKTIAAVATGNAAAGIGVIRISGCKAIEVAKRVFVPRDNSDLSNLEGYRAKYGRVLIDGIPGDDAVALVFRAPKSYTGEDVVEISVHGGIYVVEKTLEAIFEAGASPAEAGEFTKRAFLNGKIDLIQAESVANIISAQGDAALKASYNVLEGSLSKRINEVLEILEDCSSNMAAWVDYPDDEIPDLEEGVLLDRLQQAKSLIENLIDSYDSGQATVEGIETAIIGKTNVGKSTLMNLLSRKEKSIVSEYNGTTRDVIEETVRLGNIVLRLCDTAGIRKSKNEVESIGIELAEKTAENAALILAVFDNSREFDSEDRHVISKCANKKSLAVINKSDLNSKLDVSEIEASFEHIIYISAKDDKSLDVLKEAIEKIFKLEYFDSSYTFLANKRQKKCCEDALNDINESISALLSGITYDAINVVIDSAIDNLLTLTGKKATQEVVDNIFSKFCVGK